MSENNCISCLKTGDHLDIFTLKYKDQSMDSIFQMLTAIQLEKDRLDMNLNQICKACLLLLKQFYNFRTKCVQSYEKLFAMKFVPVIEYQFEFKNDNITLVDESMIKTLSEDEDQDMSKIVDQNGDEIEQEESKRAVSKLLGLDDINNLFRDHTKKWHCEHCNLIFPIEEKEEIEKHKLMEQKRLKPKISSNITVKKIKVNANNTKVTKDRPKARIQLNRKAKVANAENKSLNESYSRETDVKMFSPLATEQIRSSTIIKTLPEGSVRFGSNLISDINAMFKNDDEDDDDKEYNSAESVDGESLSKIKEKQRKKKYNFLNTSETKKVGGRRKKTVINEETQKFICDVCGKEMSYASTLRVHMTMHTGKMFVCQICGSDYVTRAGLTQHMNKHEQRKDHECHFCHKTFYSRTDLLGHIYDKRQAGSHLDDTCAPFTRPICEICGKTFYNVKTLKLHVSTHKQSKDYACPQCDRKFFHEHKLNMHLWTHEVQFRCMKCFNIYKQIELKKHTCNPVPGQTYQPLEFECRVCGQMFKGPGRYEQHQKTHNLKECKICKKKFNCSAKLFRCHLNTHSFKCTLCDKGFSKKSSWKYHVENQTCLKGKKEVQIQTLIVPSYM